VKLLHRVLFTLPIGALLTCVVYDSAGPEGPSIDGTYATTIAVSYSNYIELRTDTLLASITLQSLHNRGNFDGTYRTAFGDSGRFAGVEQPQGTLVVSEFGAPPPRKPIAYVMGMRQLYPWCDFPRLGTGPLPGRLGDDSLFAYGQGSVPCFYQLNGTPVEVRTELHLQIVGIR
jgi:hypothetical protein